MKNKRLMVVNYTDEKDVERLKANLKVCCVPFVVFKQYEFVGGGGLWKFYIDKAHLTWNQIMHVVNEVRAVKFRYETDSYIENGTLCTELNIKWNEIN